MSKHSLSVKRCVGLGNVFLLIPLLEQLADDGTAVTLVTRPEWIPPLQQLLPRLCITDRGTPDTQDLDAMTTSVFPDCHRTEEFARLLGVSYTPRRYFLRLPEPWPGTELVPPQSIAVCPEAAHPSRRFPSAVTRAFCQRLLGTPLVFIGQDTGETFPADYDLRGKTGLAELLGVIASCRLILCTDSAVLHIAAILGTPALACFTSVAPAYRLQPWQRVLAVQPGFTCVPCNKRETCAGRHQCLTALDPSLFLNLVPDALAATGLVCRRLSPCLTEPPAAQRP